MSGTILLDLVIHPDHGSYLYLAEAEDSAEPAQLWRYNPASTESIHIDLAFADPSQILVGRLRELYVQDDDDLVRVQYRYPRARGDQPCSASRQHF